MAPRNVAVTEPHPSVPKTSNAYIHSGRGGAGNYKRYQTSELSLGPSATGPASRINLSLANLKRPSFVANGRGGTGNMMHKTPGTDTEERMFQFDEEMARRSDAQAPVYHIGRGGAANFVDERSSSASQRSRQDSSSSSASMRSHSEEVRGALSKLTRRWS
ncbi:hypothetical protein BDY17DRAFT_293235 [Neohortaea acidophila]|uniref:Uncharacterized protein n=1 Tax=Neohortaea acidophila TaxID=245834 RepID=A0A6A6PYS2_9PEZI|nr:uncharacterized protein BDY17DRAFT_293235 [Neohortaea acidophila]KAF2485280.1 hypothetical protein BDY17DRAFT_293235 [Neohortaea acidophila]